MTKTLPERLRAKAGKGGIIPIDDMTILEAADELERLRGKLQAIATLKVDGVTHSVQASIWAARACA